MPQQYKSVFISYRINAAAMGARAVYQSLAMHGYDVFVDVERLTLGQFEDQLLKQITSRAHFILILSPGTLERCQEPNDWVLRELEKAISTDRNIVPLFMNNFDIQDIDAYLPQVIAEKVKRLQGVRVPYDYFDAAMDRLRRNLEAPISVILEEVTPSQAKFAQHAQAEFETKTQMGSIRLDAEWHYQQAISKTQTGDHEGSIHSYSHAISLNPEYAEAYRDRGVSYLKLDQYENALHDVNQAIKLNANDYRAFRSRGYIFNILGRYHDAIHDLTMALRINPDDAKSLYHLGIAHYHNQDHEKALANYDAALLLSPDAATFYNRGLVFHHMSRYVDAIDNYGQALGLDPHHTDALYNRAAAYSNVGEYDDALMDYTTLIHLKPDDPNIYTQRGYTHYNMGNYAAAITDYDVALSFDPNHDFAKKNRQLAILKRDAR